ncbi:DUF2812 domain-containing protein [Listeria innocua]|uniref:DUF2812 domain-containing protein n=1 Tax=Listeria innocua TaxID=1642 RepID=UPI0010D8A3ED|nr:DUF2812 domain-containing protein [Listeria innocua]EAD5752022.1 DUF2812 domain-containing protein [Listeria innocua]EBB6229261.1 DUF2812 domain-containing protein [Listeria innocua]EFV4187074.1 DUF2812 domain-containing protein [Listeria innocua]EHF3653961.1 DUF2812 domain-containing protein [Listeria innocua]EHF3672397.1 DUF2812 domain-containing protein [Listeria innocua]
MEKKVLKFFTVDNMEKEEAYLNDMAQKGWLFKEYKSFRYHFEKGELNKYRYAIDYKVNQGDEASYKALFADAGWDNVFCYPVLNGNWMYFRKLQAEEAGSETIFSDEVSYIHLYRSIRKRWTIFGTLMSILLLLDLFFLNNVGSYPVITIFIFILFIILIGLYGKMFIQLTRKINKFANKNI